MNKNKMYLKQYLKIITQFNTNNNKWINYGKYSFNKISVEIFISRDHVINRDNKRTIIINHYSTSTVQRIVKKFLKQQIKNNTLFDLLKLRNPQGLFIIYKAINNKINPIRYYSFQFQFKKGKYQLGVCTVLPNQSEPYHADTDIVITMYE